jgi:hypothetical protein
MKKIISILLLLVVIIFGSRGLRANDFQLWTEFRISHTFPDKKLSIRWAEENRFYNDATTYGLFNTTLGFDYLVWKWFRPGFYYRVEKRIGNPTENRLMPQFEFLTKLGPIFIEDRNRFEIRIFTQGDVRYRYRNRFRFGHTFKNSPVSFTPYASDEIFVETERTNPNQNRAIVGNEFGFHHDKITLALYYMLRSDKNQGAPGWTQTQVLGTSLGFKF